MFSCTARKASFLPCLTSIALTMTKTCAGPGIVLPRKPCSRTASTVRMREGKIIIIDDPFADTKEQLAGFYLIEAKHPDEAIDIAVLIPAAKEGSIKVRSIRETLKQGQ